MCAVPVGESKSSPAPRASRRQGHLVGLIGIASRDTRFERNDDHVDPTMTPPARPPVTGATTAPAGAPSVLSINDVDWQPSSFSDARATGRQFQDQGRFSEALKCYRRALYHASKQREEMSGDSPTSGGRLLLLQRSVADTLFDMGCIFTARRDLVKSSEAFYACLDLRRQTLPPTDASIAAVLYELAQLSASSDPESAVELLLEAHAILNAHAAQYADSLVQVWYAIGTVQHAMGQREAAASAFQEARSLDRIVQ